ncbi:methyl-accepting chemotaxis protein [Quadrisphaera oryzae]|uniref:methyl-accepting chemotaxis protein n=1 Tax=Quadrisphaera TaxID=317661 RepID=UPI00164541E4|nr:methyl-accepting chemotaxis protein [Quadrisphaera sp. RL12-1S]MBC3763722.1 methyl-accepting chemotaxis protein [Quadrisphaera sp. RL12-1S]
MTIAILAVVVTVVALRASSTGERQAELYNRTLAADQASSVQLTLRQAVVTVDTLAGALAALHQNGGASRTAVTAAVHDTLVANPSLLGVATAWEPNAFDGRDAAFAGASGSSADGRYGVYWYRSGGELSFTTLTSMDDPSQGDWYLGPRQSLKAMLTEPYTYKLDGKEVLMTTATAPVLVQGQFLGVVTADLALTDLTAKLQAIKPYGNGYVSLLSDKGNVVAGPSAQALGKPLQGPLAAVAQQVSAQRTAQTTSLNDPSSGGEALAAVAPVAVTDDQTWALVVSAPRATVLADVARTTWLIVLVGLVAVVLAGALTWWIGTGLVRPVRALRDSLIDIADGEGDLTRRVDSARHDELGQLGGAFNRFADTVAATVREITTEADSLHRAAGALDSTNRSLTTDIDASATRCSEVAGQAGAASAEVTTIASAAEEMGASIAEIARGTHEASRIAAEAVQVSSSTETVFEALSTSSTEIGAIVATITGIAQQTNLLALNATIEAARAGEAGKGFAVVAGEVKDLSGQTARATDDIEQRITRLLSDVGSASSSVSTIGTVVGDLDGIQTSVASAVEEQTAVTAEIATGVTRAALATTAIADTIVQVAAAAESMRFSAAAARASVQDVSATAERMRALVGRFRV